MTEIAGLDDVYTKGCNKDCPEPYLHKEYEPDSSDIYKLIQKDNTGIRYNEGKLRYDLLPAISIQGVVEVLTYGSIKYAPRNWEKGLPWMTYIASCKRHLARWEMGENIDTESSINHIKHACTNLLMLIHHIEYGVSEDNRPEIPSNFNNK